LVGFEATPTALYLSADKTVSRSAQLDQELIQNV